MHKISIFLFTDHSRGWFVDRKKARDFKRRNTVAYRYIRCLCMPRSRIALLRPKMKMVIVHSKAKQEVSKTEIRNIDDQLEIWLYDKNYGQLKYAQNKVIEATQNFFNVKNYEQVIVLMYFKNLFYWKQNVVTTVAVADKLCKVTYLRLSLPLENRVHSSTDKLSVAFLYSTEALSIQGLNMMHWLILLTVCETYFISGYVYMFLTNNFLHLRRSWKGSFYYIEINSPSLPE